MKVLTRSLVALLVLAIALGAGAPMYAQSTTVQGQASQGPNGSVSSIYNSGLLAGSAVSDTLTYGPITCSTCSGYTMSANGAATVNDGTLGASASVTASGTPPGTNLNAIALSDAVFTDILTPTGGTGSGVLQLTYALDGVISSTGIAGDSSIADLDLLNMPTTTVVQDTEGLAGGSGTTFGVTFDADGTYTDTVTFDIPITYGTPLTTEVYLDAEAVLTGFSSTYAAGRSTTANYYDTATLTSALVFGGTPTDLGTENYAADIVSASGLIYGPDGISAVSSPEPGTMSLTFLGVGLLGLIVVMRKREAQARA